MVRLRLGSAACEVQSRPLGVPSSVIHMSCPLEDIVGEVEAYAAGCNTEEGVVWCDARPWCGGLLVEVGEVLEVVPEFCSCFFEARAMVSLPL